jgi:uncharacterized protein
MLFKIYASNGVNRREFFYDNETSWLIHDGKRITGRSKQLMNDTVPYTSVDTPNGKSAEIKTLKIQLGLACNYSCEYCSQRFVPRAEDGHPSDVEKFMRNLDLWMKSVPERIEFWGGEPFAYFKTLKPLAEAMRAKFPEADFYIATNGSLLTSDIVQWICDIDIGIGVSHDGPGQHVRGPDPLDDPEQRSAILELFRRRPGKVSFNSMINRENLDRGAIQRFFEDILGRENHWGIGEGGFVDPYDEGGESQSLQTHDEALAFRRKALSDIRAGRIDRFSIMWSRMKEWVGSISWGRESDGLGQKCGMDRPDTIAVDLKGNVMTCQNVSTVSRAPNGKSHHIGHVSRLDQVKLNTATHWSSRPMCAECPLVQVCKGACMFLEGRLWDKACNNAYNDHLPFFAAAIERLTGYLPYKIESPSLPAERSDLWA